MRSSDSSKICFPVLKPKDLSGLFHEKGLDGWEVYTISVPTAGFAALMSLYAFPADTETKTTSLGLIISITLFKTSEEADALLFHTLYAREVSHKSFADFTREF